jgi:hypothetical protein
MQLNRTFTSSIKLAYNVSCFVSEALDMVPDRTKEPGFEIEADGWKKFERAVDAVVKSGPQHRFAKQTAEYAAGISDVQEAAPPALRDIMIRNSKELESTRIVPC